MINNTTNSVIIDSFDVVGNPINVPVVIKSPFNVPINSSHIEYMPFIGDVVGMKFGINISSGEFGRNIPVSPIDVSVLGMLSIHNSYFITY